MTERAIDRVRADAAEDIDGIVSELLDARLDCLRHDFDLKRVSVTTVRLRLQVARLKYVIAILETFSLTHQGEKDAF